MDLSNNTSKNIDGLNKKVEGILEDQQNSYGKEIIEGIVNNYPQSIVSRLEEEYINDPEGKKDAFQKLQAIKILENHERGNTIEVGEKVFSFLRPEGRDSREHPKGYEDVPYIHGQNLPGATYRAEKSSFHYKSEVERFIDKYVPGVSPESRCRTFSELMGLKEVLVRNILSGRDKEPRIEAFIGGDGDYGNYIYVSKNEAHIENFQFRNWALPAIVFNKDQ